jgi:hypothetical protein
VPHIAPWPAAASPWIEFVCGDAAAAAHLRYGFDSVTADQAC